MEILFFLPIFPFFGVKVAFFKLKVLKTPPFPYLMVHTYRSDTGMSRSGRMAQYDGENSPVTKQSIVMGVLLVCYVLLGMKCLGTDQNK